MTEKKPIDLGHRIHLIDLHDMGWEERTGSYVIEDEQLTLIETSASPSLPYLLKGLQTLGLDPHDVRYIIVTHIHLDHAGGAGLFLKEYPNATVVVHPKGARHLANPERLIAGAREVYKDQFDPFFAPLLPVPEDKLLIKNHEDTLCIGPNRTLTFYDTPGHANHHFSIYDPVSNGMFTGDTVGVKYAQLDELDFPFYLPSTSPNQFHPDRMLESIHLFESKKLDRIYFGHFGMSENVSEVYRQVKEWLPVFVDTAAALLQEGKGASAITASLYQQVQEYLVSHGIPESHPAFDVVKLDLEICAMGLVDYLVKKEQGKA
ncbi:MBL fold metallo-hydrolase [Brevibacillus ginsengisoli]|uniref:MBL fold metallo-hydrolase n=1 Tax=Brevibacillus ginsengisoli TaxID=363854 RepID=UPI003CF7C1A7